MGNKKKGSILVNGNYTVVPGTFLPVSEISKKMGNGIGIPSRFLPV